MSDDHLVNVLKYLKRYAAYSHNEEIDAVGGALGTLHGEMAQYHAEAYYDELCTEKSWEDFVPEIFWNLHDDMLRRGIKWE